MCTYDSYSSFFVAFVIHFEQSTFAQESFCFKLTKTRLNGKSVKMSS